MTGSEPPFDELIGLLSKAMEMEEQADAEPGTARLVWEEDADGELQPCIYLPVDVEDDQS